MLTVCSKHFKDKTREVFTQYNLTILVQEGYEKSDDVISHTAAFTVGKGKVLVGGIARDAFVIAVRGTDGAEWYSNFDFAPSHSNATQFAENFLFSAQDIFLESYRIIQKNKSVRNPVVIVCGHSRGAACANILGILFNGVYDAANVYVYTFATPATIRNQDNAEKMDNIFNVINQCDIVPKVPFSSWGFVRAGKDILLCNDKKRAAELDEAVKLLQKISPDVSSYYTVRHSITGSGVSNDGITMYEMMLLLCGKIVPATKQLLDKNSDVVNNKQIPYTKMNITSFVSSSSDFSAFAYEVEQLSNNDGNGARQLLNEHLPDTYMALLNEGD